MQHRQHEGTASERREAPPPPPFTCQIHHNSSNALQEIGRIPFLRRSALACWWSVNRLVRTSSQPCFLWTFTIEDNVPDYVFATRHSQFVKGVSIAARRQDSYDGVTIPRSWGGVRVFEHGERRGRIHAHWVVRGRMPWHYMQHLAIRAGLGRVVHVDPKPVGPQVAHYISDYLVKGDKLRGLRAWSCIGTYQGVRNCDIEQDSERIRAIKAWQIYFRMQGKHRLLAYRLAIQAVDDKKHGDPF